MTLGTGIPRWWSICEHVKHHVFEAQKMSNSRTFASPQHQDDGLMSVSMCSRPADHLLSIGSSSSGLQSEGCHTSSVRRHTARRLRGQNMSLALLLTCHFFPTHRSHLARLTPFDIRCWQVHRLPSMTCMQCVCECQHLSQIKCTTWR